MESNSADEYSRVLCESDHSIIVARKVVVYIQINCRAHSFLMKRKSSRLCDIRCFKMVNNWALTRFALKYFLYSIEVSTVLLSNFITLGKCNNGISYSLSITSDFSCTYHLTQIITNKNICEAIKRSTWTAFVHRTCVYALFNIANIRRWITLVGKVIELFVCLWR